MASKIVVVNLDKERHLRFNLNALVLLEKETGRSMSELVPDEKSGKNGFDMEMLRALLYAGLKWEDKDLTIDAVGDMIDFDNMNEVSEKLGEAMEGVK
ncbi:MAG: hypothetical protein ABF633_03205 [Clostridium sp.]|uniref:hypothetical protein n=1 Tax=Clostridium sp. TaxID=1506 RepID=UPI0039EA75FA